jgi:hypothetical protein
MADERKCVGTVGLFDDTGSLLEAARRVRDAGWHRWDCHTPYPVHGLDRAMGLKASPLPYVCLGAGFAGAGLAMLLQWWMSAVDYPVRIGGKPLFSWPAFVPITFELFVLLAALATFGGLLALSRLGRWHSPLHDSGVMHEVTSHRFGVVLLADDPKWSAQEAQALLEAARCRDIRPLYETVEEEGPQA